MTRWLLRIPLCVVVAVVAVAVHLGALRGGFHFDDESVIVLNRAALTDASSVGRALHDPSVFSGGGKQGGMFRPVAHASHVLDTALWGWEEGADAPPPLGWHLTNILLHAGCAALLYLLLRRLLRAMLPDAPGPSGGPGPATMAAFLGALWFALHPAHSEVVNYVSSRSESLAALFLLLALLAHHEAWSEGTAPVRRALLVGASCVAAFLSFGSKETGVLLPGIAAALEIWGRPGDAHLRERLRAAVVRAAPLAGAMVLYLLARQAVMGQVAVDLASRAAMEGAGVDPLQGGGRTMAAQILTQARVCVVYALLLLFPFDLAPDHGVRVAAAFDLPTAVALLGIGLLAALVVRAAARGCRGVPLAASWAALAIAPSVLVPLNVLMNEHRLYLPATGLALAAGLAAERVLTAARRFGTGARAAAGGGVVLALAAFAVVDRDRALDWSDPTRLWPRAVATSPSSWRNHMHLAVHAFRDAKREVAAGDAASPGSVEGVFHEMLGRTRMDEALASLRESHRLYPGAFETRLNLGYFHLFRGDLLQRDSHPDEPPADPKEFEEAARWFVLAEEASPGSFRAHYNLATSLARAGKVAEGIAEFERMAKEDTARTTLYAWPLSDLYRRVGRTDDALAMLAKIDSLSPPDAGIVALRRGEVLAQARRFTEGKTALEDAIRILGREDARPPLYMARLLVATGLPENLPAARMLWDAALARGHRPGPKDRAVIDALR